MRRGRASVVLAVWLGACGAASLPRRPSELPTTFEATPATALDALQCPIAARPTVPRRPHVHDVLRLASVAVDACLERCSAEDRLVVIFRIGPDGGIERFALVEPEAACLLEAPAQNCVAAVFERVCFEPSDEGEARVLAALGRMPEGRTAEEIPVHFRHGPLLLEGRPPPPIRARGWTRVHFDVDPDGHVQNAERLDGDASMAERVLLAVRRWRFMPAVDPEGRATWARDLRVRYLFPGGRRMTRPVRDRDTLGSVFAFPEVP